jgi:hypothetical protein
VEISIICGKEEINVKMAQWLNILMYQYANVPMGIFVEDAYYYLL